MASTPKEGGSSQDSGDFEFEGEGWLGLKKMAALTGLSYQTILKLVLRKAILAVRIGGGYRIYESEIRRFMREGNHPECLPANEVWGKKDQTETKK